MTDDSARSNQDILFFILCIYSFVDVYFILITSIRRIQGDSTAFKSQFAYLLSTFGWAMLHILNQMISKCWIICKLYAFFLHATHLFVILYIWEVLEWYDPSRWTGTYTDADRLLLRTSPKLAHLIKLLTVIYVGAFLYCDSIRGCTMGPKVCLPTTEMTKLSGGLMLISKGIQMLIIYEFFRKNNIFREKLRAVGLPLSEEMVRKLTMLTITSIAIAFTDVLAIGSGMLLLVISSNDINEEQRIHGSHNINIILICDIMVNAVLMMCGNNWRSVSIYHLICQRTHVENTASSSDDALPDDISEADDIPLGGSYNTVNIASLEHEMQNARAFTIITTANGERISLRRIHHSGTKREIELAIVNGVQPDLRIDLSSTRESSTCDTDATSSGIDLVFPEEYVKKEPALAKALEARRLEVEKRQRARQAISNIILNGMQSDLRISFSSESESSTRDTNELSSGIDLLFPEEYEKQEPALARALETWRLGMEKKPREKAKGRQAISSTMLNGIQPDLRVDFSSERESSTRDAIASSSGGDVLPEDYEKQEPALARALESWRLGMEKKPREKAKGQQAISTIIKHGSFSALVTHERKF